MPSQVDTRPFRVGETMAVTQGAVVHRSDVRADPVQADHGQDRQLPTVIIPPQINRYYFLDLAPGRSFVEYAVSRGIPTFMISWRNPGPDAAATGASTTTPRPASRPCGSPPTSRPGPTVNVIGFCAGGMTDGHASRHLAPTGDDLVNAAALAVTPDRHRHDEHPQHVRERAHACSSAISRVAPQGHPRRGSLGTVFAWVRPNDLVWNYWVSNYLLGENPPAFDVLAWNADATNLPASAARRVHAHLGRQLLDEARRHHRARHPRRPGQVKNDMYVVGALTDHLVPWPSAYAATQAFGGKVRFVLSNSGHIQALVNPPGNPKASFYSVDVAPPDPERWLAGAYRVTGSWWEDWADWTLARSGRTAAQAAATLGNRHHRSPAQVAAPGSYVRTESTQSATMMDVAADDLAAVQRRRAAPPSGRGGQPRCPSATIHRYTLRRLLAPAPSS